MEESSRACSGVNGGGDVSSRRVDRILGHMTFKTSLPMAASVPCFAHTLDIHGVDPGRCHECRVYLSLIGEDHKCSKWT